MERKVINIGKVNKKLTSEEIQEKIYRAEEDYNNGKVIDADDLFQEWDRKYGVQN